MLHIYHRCHSNSMENSGHNRRQDRNSNAVSPITEINRIVDSGSIHRERQSFSAYTFGSAVTAAAHTLIHSLVLTHFSRLTRKRLIARTIDASDSSAQYTTTNDYILLLSSLLYVDRESESKEGDRGGLKSSLECRRVEF